MIPNLLSLSRLPLAVVLCVAIAHTWWLVALIVFCIAAFTDWLDGWWARRYHQQTLIGRNLDPLTDKVLIGSALIFLQDLKIGVDAWMVATILGREMFITGLRGIVEATGVKFGADWFGKSKTVLQFAALFAIFIEHLAVSDELRPLVKGLLYTVVFVTLGSGVQYCVKAARILARHPAARDGSGRE